MKTLKILSFLAVVLAMVAAGCTKTDHSSSLYAHIAGYVINEETLLPIEGADVTISPTSMGRISGTDGLFEYFDLEPGQYTVTARRKGYRSNRRTVVCSAGETTRIDIMLSAE